MEKVIDVSVHSEVYKVCEFEDDVKNMETAIGVGIYLYNHVKDPERISISFSEVVDDED